MLVNLLKRWKFDFYDEPKFRKMKFEKRKTSFQCSEKFDVYELLGVWNVEITKVEVLRQSNGH